MMLWRVFRFEFGYQMRQPWVWLTLAVLVVFAFFSTRVAILPVTLPKDFILNSPFIIASVSVFSCQIWLLLSPIIAGDAAARDISTGMYPLTYTSPISKRDYLGGRLLAAILLNAIVLLGVQVGSLLAAFGPGANPDIIGPFRPLAYLAAFCLIALPNVLVAITVQFWVALKTGKPLASYIGSVLLFFLSYPVTFFLYMSGLNERALLADPIGVMAIMNEMMSKWTIVEKNVRMFTLEGHMLFNRLLWIGISLVSLVILYLRFRFSHRTENDLLSQLRRLFSRPRATENILARPVAITVPPGRQSFSFTAHLRQAASVAGLSFRMIAGSPSGLFLLIVYPLFVVLVLLQETEQWGIPIMPRTGYILAKHLTAPLTYFSDFRVIIPLLIVYYTGELVWQERDARLSENVDATPVPEWALFLGKYLGLSLVLVAFMGSYTLAGMLAQTLNGYYNYEPLRYLQILLGLQLPEYLLFGALAFVVQAVVNQKHLGLLVTLVVYFLIIFAPYLGIQHR